MPLNNLKIIEITTYLCLIQNIYSILEFFFVTENIPMVQTMTSPNRCLKKRNGRRNSNSVPNKHSLPDNTPDYIQSNQSLTIDRVALFVMPLLYICISLLYWITYLRYSRWDEINVILIW